MFGIGAHVLAGRSCAAIFLCGSLLTHIVLWKHLTAFPFPFTPTNQRGKYLGQDFYQVDPLLINVKDLAVGKEKGIKGGPEREGSRSHLDWIRRFISLRDTHTLTLLILSVPNLPFISYILHPSHGALPVGCLSYSFWYFDGRGGSSFGAPPAVFQDSRARRRSRS